MLRTLPGYFGRLELRSTLSGLAAMVYDWQCRADERQHLALLDDRMLQDVGISRPQALAESRKPFWRI